MSNMLCCCIKTTLWQCQENSRRPRKLSQCRLCVCECLLILTQTCFSFAIQLFSFASIFPAANVLHSSNNGIGPMKLCSTNVSHDGPHKYQYWLIQTMYSTPCVMLVAHDAFLRSDQRNPQQQHNQQFHFLCE